MIRSRSIRSALVAALAVVSAALAGAATAAPASQPLRGVPRGFVGMVMDEPVWPDPFVDLQSNVDFMAASGVESIRVVVRWSNAQPYRRFKDVPKAERPRFANVGGVPTDFSAFDQVVTAASRDHMQVMPVVLDAPSWDGETRPGALVNIPKSDGPYAAFVKALVRRYGPGGSFWHTYTYDFPEPITMWQIWNEPNIYPFWPFRPFEARYTALLIAASKAIKSADPSAKVALAGMPNYSWIDLQHIYQINGAGKAFDVVAAHPYTKDPKGVLTIIGYVRNVMNRNGDKKKPIMADEISWPSSVGQTTHSTGYDFATTESGQAKNLGKVMPMLQASRKRLGLIGFFYYDWAGLERPNELAFDFSGLLRLKEGKFTAKPAYFSFRKAALAMEGCGSKTHDATSCNQ